MNLHLLLWCSLYAAFAVLAFRRPVWGLALYYLTFFAHPDFWWWGGPFKGVSVNLVAALIVLAAVTVSGNGMRLGVGATGGLRRTCQWAALIVVNATVVHFLLAADLSVSSVIYIKLLKYTLFFFLIIAVVRTEEDFKLLVLIFVVGIAYWGYEAVFAGVGSGQVRLTKIGGPDAVGDNGISGIIAMVLPLAGGLLFVGRKWEMAVGALSAALGLELLNRCNSRAAFLAAIGAACVLLLAAKGRLRRKALIGLVLGLLATGVLLARDPRVVRRFMSSFASAEERDLSAGSRFFTWKAALRMVHDYPLGSGGDGYKHTPRGQSYRDEVLPEAVAALGPGGWVPSAVQNGFIKEATQWGVQGLALKLLLLGGGLLCVYRAIDYRRQLGDENAAFFGACVMAAVAAFMIRCFFGDTLNSEPVYWAAAIAITYAKVYGPSSVGATAPAAFGVAHDGIYGYSLEADIVAPHCG